MNWEAMRFVKSPSDKFFRTSFSKLWRCLRQFNSADDGVSAIEFALIGPMLILSLLAMVDVGFALSDRMTLDNVLRSAAQNAMRDPGQESVEAILAAAAAQNSAATAYSFTAQRFCACPETLESQVACMADICPGNVPPHIFYDMSAGGAYEGILIPRILLATKLHVQIR